MRAHRWLLLGVVSCSFPPYPLPPRDGQSVPPKAAPAKGSDPSQTQSVRATGCTESELESSAEDTLHGQATYYADSLAGNKTASGQVYHPELLSAAHRTLPFGSRLRVTRIDTAVRHVVCVSVNDRGPFAGPKRILDLSRAGAEALDMIRAGVVEVQIDVL